MPSPRALLIMLAIILLIVSPFVVFFLPLIYILTFFDTPEQIVAHPNTKNYMYAFSACAIIIVAIILAAIRQNKSMIALSVTLGLAGCALFFTSIFGYTYIGTVELPPLSHSLNVLEVGDSYEQCLLVPTARTAASLLE